LPDDTKLRPHEYGAPVHAKAIDLDISTCSRCGTTRAEIVYAAGKRTGYRVQPDGRAFAKELPCVPIDKLLSLARNAAASKPEALSAAHRAVALVLEHELVWHPETPLLTNALTLLSSAATDADKRTASLAVARASESAILVTDIERKALRKRALPKRQEDLTARLREASSEIVRFGRDFFSMLAGNVEVAEGVTMAQAGAKVTRTIEDLKVEAEDFQRELSELLGGETKIKPRRASRAAQPVPRRAAPRRTQGTPRKATQPAKKKKKGTRVQ
jgi:hypothetical protein